MPTPVALCIEELAAPCRFVQCVALEGLQPGLRIDAVGRVLWREDSRAAFALCVSGDDRLVLLIPEGGEACELKVHRGGRSVQATEGKPVVLLHGDCIEVGARLLRLHVHGPAECVHEPRVLERQSRRWKFRAAAATLAIGAVVGAAGSASGQTTEKLPADDGGGAGGAEGSPDGGTESDGAAEAEASIEVREFPPVIVRQPSGCCGRNPGYD